MTCSLAGAMTTTVALTSLYRTLPTPAKALLGLACLGAVLAAAMASSDESRAGSRDELPFTLSVEADAGAVAEPASTVVSFSLPVHLPASLARPPVRPAVATAAVDDGTQRLLQAIAEVESRGNPSRVGRLGERGLYQFRRETWRQHTREHFHRAHHPGVANAVARRHYQWIVRQLRAQGRPATAYEVALAWNAGVSSVLNGRAPARAHRYAERVVNLAGQS